MANVYIAPLPKGNDPNIIGYSIETEAGEELSRYSTQEVAVDVAKSAGHVVYVACVRHPDKGISDDWRKLCQKRKQDDDTV